MPELSPYNTAIALGRSAPSYVVDQHDKARVTAYWTYGDIFHNHPEVFEVVMRELDTEDEDSRRLVPSGRIIVEATNRYYGKDLQWGLSDDATATTEQFAEIYRMHLAPLFARERFYSKWASLKRWKLIRGDGLLHITVDPSKPEGKRISITEIDPAQYFTISDAMNPSRLLGAYVVTIVEDDEGEEIAQRLEYQRILTPEDATTYGGPIGSVWTRMTYWEVDGWDGRDPENDMKPVDTPRSVNTPSMAPLLAGFVLPQQIQAIPLYHFANNAAGNSPWGTSEMQGIETLIAGVNQTATDEDLAIALYGLGMYATDSGRPRDAAGNETDWFIYPGAVWELEPDKKVDRIQGVTTVQPFQDHTSMLVEGMREGTATPDVAVGKVDVQIAQSGVALAIQFNPIVAKNEEKELADISTLNQMMYDLLNGWLAAYEGYAAVDGLTISASFADPLPIDRAATLAEILAMVTAKIISTAFAAQLVQQRLGYRIPAGMIAEVAKEQAALLDAAGARLGVDAGTGVNPDGTPQDNGAQPVA
jgi:hypothetical protein